MWKCFSELAKFCQKDIFDYFGIFFGTCWDIFACVGRYLGDARYLQVQRQGLPLSQTDLAQGHTSFYCTLLHCICYTIQCTLYIWHYTVYIVHFILYSVHCTVYAIRCTSYILHYTGLHCKVNSLQYSTHSMLHSQILGPWHFLTL